MKEAKTRVVITMCTDIAVWAMFQLLKCGGNPLKTKFRVTLSSCPGRHCTKCDRAIIDISLQAAENEDQIRSYPTREKEDGRVLSLAWVTPR